MKKPPTIVAFLPSAGYRDNRATKHTYVETRECELTDKKGKPLGKPKAWEHIYRCDITGEERRWGVEDRISWEEN